MALRKTIAGFRQELDVMLPLMNGLGQPALDENGQQKYTPHREVLWVEQLHVDMHPMEESEIQASWRMGESLQIKPNPPTKEQEHEWMIEHGSDFVKQKRAEYKDLHDKWLINHQPIADAHQDAHQKYVAWSQTDEAIAHRYDTHGKHVKESIDNHLNKIGAKLR